MWWPTMHLYKYMLNTCVFMLLRICAQPHYWPDLGLCMLKSRTWNTRNKTPYRPSLKAKTKIHKHIFNLKMFLYYCFSLSPGMNQVLMQIWLQSYDLLTVQTTADVVWRGFGAFGKASVTTSRYSYNYFTKKWNLRTFYHRLCSSCALAQCIFICIILPHQVFFSHTKHTVFTWEKCSLQI